MTILPFFFLWTFCTFHYHYHKIQCTSEATKTCYYWYLHMAPTRLLIHRSVRCEWTLRELHWFAASVPDIFVMYPFLGSTQPPYIQLNIFAFEVSSFYAMNLQNQQLNLLSDCHGNSCKDALLHHSFSGYLVFVFKIWN